MRLRTILSAMGPLLLRRLQRPSMQVCLSSFSILGTALVFNSATCERLDSVSAKRSIPITAPAVWITLQALLLRSTITGMKLCASPTLSNICTDRFFCRCVKCFECPRCSATLTFSQNIQSDEYFLKCGHCRWSSLSALSKGEGSASTPEDLSAKILKRETEQAKAPLESTTAVIHALHEEHLEVMFQKRQKRSEKILLKAAPERALSSSLSSRKFMSISLYIHCIRSISLHQITGEGVHAAVHHLENARLAQQKSRSFKEISLSRKGRSDGQALTILDGTACDIAEKFLDAN